MLTVIPYSKRVWTKWDTFGKCLCCIAGVNRSKDCQIVFFYFHSSPPPPPPKVGEFTSLQFWVFAVLPGMHGSSTQVCPGDTKNCTSHCGTQPASSNQEDNRTGTPGPLFALLPCSADVANPKLTLLQTRSFLSCGTNPKLRQPHFYVFFLRSGTFVRNFRSCLQSVLQFHLAKRFIWQKLLCELP